MDSLIKSENDRNDHPHLASPLKGEEILAVEGVLHLQQSASSEVKNTTPSEIRGFWLSPE